MSRFRLSRRARADLDGIWDYLAIEKDSPRAAYSQVEAIYDRLTLLASQPLMGELREDLRPRLRTFVSGSYVILYYPTSDGVEVAGVVHGARDLEAMFRSGER